MLSSMREKTLGVSIEHAKDAALLKEAIQSAIKTAEGTLNSDEIARVLIASVKDAQLLEQLFGRPALS